MTDRLNIPSRNFFERTKLKLSASISIAGIGVMLLGFCAFSAGQAASYNTMYTKFDKTQNDDYLKSAAQQQLGGYGFASFCYILACILLIAAAAYISPLMCGSHYEQKMIRSPQNLDGGYASFENGDATRRV